MRRSVIPFASWDELHARVPFDRQPWHLDGHDDDLLRWIRPRFSTPLAILEVGAGAGSQSIALAADGHRVVATDISDSAVRNARARADAHGLACRFIVDDILDSKLAEQFDIIFDRGCFHCIHADERAPYASTVSRLVKPAGHLLLKCLDDREKDDWGGPYRINRAIIETVFGSTFDLVDHEETVYQGRFDNIGGHQPAASFFALRRRPGSHGRD